MRRKGRGKMGEVYEFGSGEKITGWEMNFC